MYDSRIDELARQLVSYSIGIEAGNNILIELFDAPDAVALALIRAVRAAKGMPYVNVYHSRIARELGLEATETQFETIGEYTLHQMQAMDAYIAVRGSDNISELSDIPDKNKKLIAAKMRPTQDYRVGKTRWCVLRWPTPSMAQQAMMSTEAFEDFYFRVCLLDYQSLMPAMAELKKLMDETDKVHITAPDTDLHFSIGGLQAIACGGKHNIPDGEVFTAPVKESVEGVLSFNTPTLYQGVSFDDIRLEFEKGKIVDAKCNNTRAMNHILDSDPGARYVGEFAIGFNNEILKPMRDTLFDEKIGGSFHFTPGQAYEGVADNGNRSQVHWDMVQIQRQDWGGGTIEFDGKVIREDGVFLPESLEPLNPSH